METTAISLIPPLIVILLVIATRRVIISISAGIIASGIIGKMAGKTVVYGGITPCIMGTDDVY